MHFQTAMKIVSTAGLVGAFAMIVGDVNLRAVPIRGGERCFRCDRIVANRFVAAEAIEGSVGYKFRTVRCMLTYLKDSSQRFDQILVADYQTGKLVPVGKASFVPVAIGEISGEPRYGIGSTDYVAFHSRSAADRFASARGATPVTWATVRSSEAKPVVSLVYHEAQ